MDPAMRISAAAPVARRDIATAVSCCVCFPAETAAWPKLRIMIRF
jgi:hypothetical protein